MYGARDPKVELSTILTPVAITALPTMTPLCLLGQMKEIHALADPLIGRFLAADPNTVERWKTLLEQNTPGAKLIGAPMFVAQGEADELVRPTRFGGSGPSEWSTSPPPVPPIRSHRGGGYR